METTQRINEYVTFRLDNDEELVNEKGDVVSSNRRNINVDVTDTKPFETKTIVNKFQEFMIQVGRDKKTFDFGNESLYDVIMDWHLRNEPDLTCNGEESLDDDDDSVTEKIDFCGLELNAKSKKKIKDGMNELADCFQEILEQFQNSMDDKKSK